MEAPELTTEIIKNIQKKMENPSLTYEEFESLIDEVISEFIEDGRMTEDEDSVVLRENLQSRFPEIAENARIENEDNV
ncbi:MAG: hypothetical protein V1685_01110 [Parcubacteria group bacterium]